MKQKTVINYWDENVDTHIEAYNSASSDDIRNQIWMDHLNSPFDKLVECVINRYKSRSGYAFAEHGYETLHAIILGHCAKVLTNYKKTNGKSFGYFSTVVKYALILENNNCYTRFKRDESMEVLTDEQNHDHILRPDVIGKYDHPEIDFSEYFQQFIEYINLNKKTLFTRIQLKKLDEILNFISNIKNYDGKFSKRQFWVAVRNGKNSKVEKQKNSVQAARVMEKLIPIHKRCFNRYISVGTV